MLCGLAQYLCQPAEHEAGPASQLLSAPQTASARGGLKST